MEFLSGWHIELMDPDRVPYAIAAIFLAMIMGIISGPLAGNANPFLWLVIDKIFGELGDRLDRAERARGDLVFRGFLLTAMVLFSVLVLGKLYERFVLENNPHGVSEVIVLALLISVGSVWFALLRLYFALEKERAGEKSRKARIMRSHALPAPIWPQMTILVSRAAVWGSLRVA